jgi:hypothetical protein
LDSRGEAKGVAILKSALKREATDDVGGSSQAQEQVFGA